MARTSYKVSATTILFAFSATTALAQNIPNSARPDVVERQYKIEAPRPDVGGAPLISVEGQGGKSIKGNVRFTLNSVAIEGATAYDKKELEPLYKDRIGQTISLNELNGIADAITAYYRNNGYILTRAVVPPQRIRGGNVTIRVIEGFVNDVRIEGDDVAGDSLIQAYADKIKASKPLDAKKLERYLLLMEDLPGVEARAVLQPSASVQGASDVIINIKRKFVDLAASLDNRGSRFLGPVQASATAGVNNLFGLNEQTQFRVANSIFDSDELLFGDIRHEEQIGTEGTALVFSVSHVETNPGHTLETTDVEGDSSSFAVGVSHPIIRSRQTNWFVNADFTMRQVDVDASDIGVYHDQTRVLNLGTSYDFVDSWLAINRFDAAIAHGFGWGTGLENDGEPRSRASAEPTFTKLTGRYSRLQPIDGPFSAYFVTAGQASFDPLVASEEFAIGGSEFGSAYDSAELTGDSGIAARAELQYNQSVDAAWLAQYQLYTFYDFGKIWNQDILVASEVSSASLSSAGLGVRFNLNENLSGGLEGAIPLTHDVAALGEDGSAPRAFFSLQYRY